MKSLYTLFLPLLAAALLIRPSLTQTEEFSGSGAGEGSEDGCRQPSIVDDLHRTDEDETVIEIRCHLACIDYVSYTHIVTTTFFGQSNFFCGLITLGKLCAE